MKKFTLFLFLVIGVIASAQVGINTDTPDASSMLDIQSTDSGVLIPRVSLTNVNVTQLDGTNTAATGLLIYNTNAATVNGAGTGFYYYNGTIWQPINTDTPDADFYEVGTTTPPNDTNDAMYHMGQTLIGSSAATTNGKLQVTNTDENLTYGLNVIQDRSTGTNVYTARFTNRLDGNSGGGFFNILDIDAAINNVYGNYTSVTSVSPTEHTTTGTYQQFDIDGNKDITGVSNTFLNSGVDDKIGFRNSFPSSSAGTFYGLYNSIRGLGSQSKYGTYSRFYNSVEGTLYGNYSYFQQTGSNTSYGAYNRFSDGTGVRYGTYNTFSNSTGNTYGTYNSFPSSATGRFYGLYNTIGTSSSVQRKYGVYTVISSTAAGVNYGIYNDVRNLNSYAGYFIGRMSLGNTTTSSERYLMPATSGAVGEVLAMSAAGVTDFVDLTTSFWSTSGNTITSASRIGSNNSFPVIVKTNNNDRFRFETNGTLRSISNGTETSPSFSFLENTRSGMYLASNNTDLTLTSNGYDFFTLKEFGTSRQVTINPDGDPEMNFQVRGDSGVIISAHPTKENVEIGANSNPEYASLALSHNDKGFLMNRVRLTSATSFAPLPSSPSRGTMVYNTVENLTPAGYRNDVRVGTYVWNGSRWKPQFAEDRSARFGNAANRNKNLNTTAGTELELFEFNEWNDDSSLFTTIEGPSQTRLTVNEEGRYRVFVAMAIIIDPTTTVVDLQLDAELRINRSGSIVHPGSPTANNFIRNRNGSNTSSINITEIIEIQAGDEIFVHVEQAANNGTITMRPEAGSNFFTIEKIK